MAVDIEIATLVIEMVDPCTLKPHPKAALIPMSEEDRKILRDGIEREGRVHTPLQRNINSEILDGIHRWQISLDLKIPQIPVVTLPFRSPSEEELHALRSNLERRQMNEGQKACLWTEIFKSEQKVTEENKKEANREARTQHISQKRQEDNLPPIHVKVPAPVREPSHQNPVLPQKNRENEAAEKVAKKAQVSARSMYQAKIVEEQAPELKDAVLQGNISLKKAYTQVQTEKKSQELKEAMQTGKALTDLEIMQKL